MESGSPSTPHHRALLLPGLDGTGLLFRRFVDLRPPQFHAQVLAYPSTLATYAEAEELVASRLPVDGRVLLIAESFSGPIAVRIAARFEHRISGVVLVASFVRSPVASIARAVPWRAVFSVRAPAVALRRMLLGQDCPDSLVDELRVVLQPLPSRTLAQRIRAVLTVDASAQLRACAVPMLYIAGQDDRLVGRRSLAAIHAIRPELEHISVSAPHLILQRNPTAAWQAIERFAAEF